MSYKIKMRDNSEIIVPDEAGRALEEHWLGLTKPEPIEIGGNAYMSSEMRSITKSNISSNEPNSKQISGPKYNCAPYSIQRHIMQVAVRRNEVKKLKDESYREKIRLTLCEKYPNKKWCDHREAEHACIKTVL
jgi:hypothetical protein